MTLAAQKTLSVATDQTPYSILDIRHQCFGQLGQAASICFTPSDLRLILQMPQHQ